MRMNIRVPGILALTLLGGVLISCGTKTEVEVREEKAEVKTEAREAGRETEGAMREAGRDIKEGAQDAGNAVAEGAHDAGHAIADATKEVGDEIKAGAQTIDVKATLMADSTIDASHIDVDTNDDTKTVYLRGSVPTAAQKAAAETIAKNHAPNYTVTNELVVAAAH